MTQIALKTLLCTHKPPKRHPRAVTGYCAALGMFAAGTSATCLSYDSLQPLAAYLSLAGLGALILWVCHVNSPMERLAYTVLFAVGTVAGAINAVYMRQLGSLDGESDAVGNYHASTADFLHESLPDLRVRIEGALSTYVWRELYTVWSLLGGDKEMYLGIAVNCTLVGLSAAFGIRMVRMVFGEDWYRCRRMLLLMATCGPLMLSAGTHLREAFVALLVAIIVLAWLSWLTCPKSTARAAYCVVATGSTTAASTFSARNFYSFLCWPRLLEWARTFCSGLAQNVSLHRHLSLCPLRSWEQPPCTAISCRRCWHTRLKGTSTTQNGVPRPPRRTRWA